MLLKDFYSVGHTTQVDGEFTTEIKINKDHGLYKGHFPHRPVTPGVILMQLFKEEAERQVCSKLKLEKAVNVKFMAVVDPNEEENLILSCSLEEDQGWVNLKGSAKHKGCIALKINALYKKII